MKKESDSRLYELYGMKFEDQPSFLRNNLIASSFYTDIILAMIIHQRGNGKIDQLILDENDMHVDLNTFMEKQNAVALDYVNVCKKTDKYYKMNITMDGMSFYKSQSIKFNIKVPTLRKRISLYTLNRTRRLRSFMLKVWRVFISANKTIKTITESGIIKLILLFITLFGLMYIG